MFKGMWFRQIGIVRRDFFTVFILVLNAFVWSFMTVTTLNIVLDEINITDAEKLIVRMAYYTMVIVSSFIGSIFSTRVRRLHFLYVWMGLGMLFSLIPIFLSIDTLTSVLGISFLWAASFGLGLPSCLSYFADFAPIENRGRIGGIINLVIYISIPFFALSLLTLDLKLLVTISAIWRGGGLILFFLLKPKEVMDIKTRKNPTHLSVLRDKSFILYFIPWMMFSLINRLEAPILELHFEPNFYGFMIMTEFFISSISAFVAGLLSDLVGRKRVVLYGFITLGIAYALLGIAPGVSFSAYVYLVIDGIAWGIFALVFVMVLWGDLSQNMVKEKYYFLGGIPLISSDLIQLLLNPYVRLIPEYAAFSLASFFLFLAVLPLMYAPETLPEKKIELRRLRKYVEKAKEIREEYVEKRA